MTISEYQFFGYGTAPGQEERMSDKKKPIVEWHYGPINGELGKLVDGQWEKWDWPQRIAGMEQFLQLRKSGEIVLTESVTYGHPLVHGHSGRFDIYVAKEQA